MTSNYSAPLASWYISCCTGVTPSDDDDFESDGATTILPSKICQPLHSSSGNYSVGKETTKDYMDWFLQPNNFPLLNMEIDEIAPITTTNPNNHSVLAERLLKKLPPWTSNVINWQLYVHLVNSLTTLRVIKVKIIFYVLKTCYFQLMKLFQHPDTVCGQMTNYNMLDTHCLIL